MLHLQNMRNRIIQLKRNRRMKLRAFSNFALCVIFPAIYVILHVGQLLLFKEHLETDVRFDIKKKFGIIYFHSTPTYFIHFAVVIHTASDWCLSASSYSLVQCLSLILLDPIREIGSVLFILLLTSW